jgi:SPP1 family predicted phage head-tail adaptor
MDQRITLQQPAATVDALGQRTETWADLATVWAQAQPLRGREFFAAGQINSEASVRFRIRWRADVTGAMRVLWRGVPHDIESVIEPNGGREQLELMCATAARDGR